MPNSPTLRVLLIRCGDSACALPLHGLGEVMRPLPLELAPRAPAFVLGVAVVRGVSVPVVNLTSLVTGSSNSPVRRWVSLSVEERSVVLGVTDVVGMRDVPRSAFAALSPLLGEDASGFVQALAALDSELLRVLRDARSLGRELLDLLSRHEVQA